jgi:hypothetical protein
VTKHLSSEPAVLPLIPVEGESQARPNFPSVNASEKLPWLADTMTPFARGWIKQSIWRFSVIFPYWQWNVDVASGSVMTSIVVWIVLPPCKIN